MSCDVGGCGRSVVARGLCSGHYAWAQDRDFQETPTHQLQEYSQPDDEDLKKCTNCGDVKGVDKFYRNKNFSDGRYTSVNSVVTKELRHGASAGGSA